MIRKESAETQDHASCQDMEVDNDKSLEVMGFVPSAVSKSAGWHEPLRVTRSATKRASMFYDLAATLVEDDGNPDTITG